MAAAAMAEAAAAAAAAAAEAEATAAGEAAEAAAAEDELKAATSHGAEDPTRLQRAIAAARQRAVDAALLRKAEAAQAAAKAAVEREAAERIEAGAAVSEPGMRRWRSRGGGDRIERRDTDHKRGWGGQPRHGSLGRAALDNIRVGGEDGLREAGLSRLGA